MMDVYEFKNKSWYNNHGEYTHIYKCISHKFDVYQGRHHCYIGALSHSGTIDDDTLLKMTPEALKKACIDNNITVVIHD